MLLGLLAATLVCALAFYAIVKAAIRITKRLGMDPMTVLLWLGLAEEPVAHPRAERRRLAELVAD
jgi:hypothetical protein